MVGGRQKGQKGKLEGDMGRGYYVVLQRCIGVLFFYISIPFPFFFRVGKV